MQGGYCTNDRHAMVLWPLSWTSRQTGRVKPGPSLIQTKAASVRVTWASGEKTPWMSFHRRTYVPINHKHSKPCCGLALVFCFQASKCIKLYWKTWLNRDLKETVQSFKGNYQARGGDPASLGILDSSRHLLMILATLHSLPFSLLLRLHAPSLWSGPVCDKLFAVDPQAVPTSVHQSSAHNEPWNRNHTLLTSKALHTARALSPKLSTQKKMQLVTSPKKSVNTDTYR